jgi:K+ transporter
VPVADVNGLAALFAVISRNADSAAAFFRVSDKCVIELGARLHF